MDKIKVGIALFGISIVGLFGIEILKVDEKYYQGFDTIEEYKVKRDVVFDRIQYHRAVKENGEEFLDFSKETMPFSEFQEMINFVNFEGMRCETPRDTKSFLDAFDKVKACKE